MAKIVATSDLHGIVWDTHIPECDLLLIGGDICPYWNHDLKFQRAWIKSDFTDWLRQIPAKRIVGIAGNHDFILERDPELGYSLPWTYLCDETVEIDGIKIHGSPYTPLYGNWAFMKMDNELYDHWQKIPVDVDVLMVHGPAFGIGDLIETPNSFNLGEHVGSRSLHSRLQAVNPRLYVFGHIHEGYGDYTTSNMKMFNVARMDMRYKPMNPVKEMIL